MTRKKKNQLFGRHFERYNILSILWQYCYFVIVHTYMVQISLQTSGGKVVFLVGGSMEPKGVKVPCSLKDVFSDSNNIIL